MSKDQNRSEVVERARQAFGTDYLNADPPLCKKKVGRAHPGRGEAGRDVSSGCGATNGEWETGVQRRRTVATHWEDHTRRPSLLRLWLTVKAGASDLQNILREPCTRPRLPGGMASRNDECSNDERCGAHTREMCGTFMERVREAHRCQYGHAFRGPVGSADRPPCQPLRYWADIRNPLALPSLATRAALHATSHGVR